MDLDRFEVLSFDCYGTLIDWESGLLACLGGLLSKRCIQWDAEPLLELYASLETRLEAEPYRTYREVLAHVIDGVGRAFDFTPTADERLALAASLPTWRPFPDTVGALAALKRKYKLAIISNIDRDLFRETNRHLEVEFDWVISAQDVGSYKPSPRNFQLAMERIGARPDRHLHVAQSLYHDIAPARELGLSTCWVNRRQGKSSPGATLKSDARPDLEVPDLAALARMAGFQPWRQSA